MVVSVMMDQYAATIYTFGIDRGKGVEGNEGKAKATASSQAGGVEGRGRVATHLVVLATR